MKFGSLDRLVLCIAAIALPLLLIYGLWVGNSLAKVLITVLLLVLAARWVYWVYHRH